MGILEGLVPTLAVTLILRHPSFCRALIHNHLVTVELAEKPLAGHASVGSSLNVDFDIKSVFKLALKMQDIPPNVRVRKRYEGYIDIAVLRLLATGHRTIEPRPGNGPTIKDGLYGAGDLGGIQLPRIDSNSQGHGAPFPQNGTPA